MKKYSKLMAILLVFAMILAGVAQAAPVVEAEEVNSNVIRLSGADRIKTSVKVSQTAYKDGAESVVIVGYEGEVDALAGTLLAHAKKGPVLFTKKGKLSEDTKTEIARLGAKNVYILGGTATIEDAVKTELETLKYTVKRISGSNREGTAAAVAKEVGGKTTHVFLARGYGDLRAVLSDALAVGPASAKGNMAVLLTRTDKVPAATLKSMKDLGVTNVTIVGGEGAVNSGVKTELETLKYTVDRLSGTTREGTAIAIANKYFAGKANALVANGYGSPDALVGGYLGAAIDAPILFSQANKVSEVTTDYLKANTEKAWILGGERVVNKEVLNKVLGAVVPTPTPPSTGGGSGGGSGDNVAVNTISVKPTELTLKVVDSGNITATVEPDNAANKNVTWSSSDEKIATVDEDGNVTAVAAGTATITATSNNGKTATTTVTVLAENTVAMIGTEQYTSLAAAVAAVPQNGTATITLLNDITLTGKIDITDGKNIKLDLNGKTISSELATAFNLTKGTLNVVDTAATKGGISVSGEAFRVNGRDNSDASGAVLDISAGVNVTSSTDCAVFIYGKATLNTAGNLTSNGVYAPIQGNGTVSSNGTVINITGGKVVAILAGYHAIYVPQDGVMNITGGEISSAGTAIEAKGGTLTISGGTISTSATSTSHVPNGNGGSAVGYALAVIDNAGYAGAQVTVSGGTFDGPVALLDDDSDATNNHSSLIINAISAMPTSIQSILDQAGDGTTINLTAGEYGTIYLRQSESKSQSVDVTNWAGDGDVERYREFKDISIVGTDGAKVDQITVEAMQYGTKIDQPHSNSEYMTDYLSSYIAVKNLTIKNIEFTGNKGPAVRLQSIWGHSSINGLTIDECSLTGKEQHKTAKESFLLAANGDTSKEIKDKTNNNLIMTTGRNNLTVKNCTVDDVWMPINVTEWHGIDIRDNNFSNTGRNDIIITGTSVGDVNIIGNTLSNAAERSIRLNTITGKISITGNTIKDCVGREIKAEDGTVLGTSLMHISASGENTAVVLSGNSWNGLNDETAVTANDKNILLESDAKFTVNTVK